MKLFKLIRRWIDFRSRGIKVWPGSYVYLSAKIGNNVSIGRNSEIGNNVQIGDNTRIGAGCFIPEGIVIGSNCFIGPMTCLSNDMYPPGNKKDWKKTIICNKSAIGAHCSIRPGVVIGSNSLIGMGSVVTKHIPENEVWAGVPCKKIRNKLFKEK